MAETRPRLLALLGAAAIALTACDSSVDGVAAPRQTVPSIPSARPSSSGNPFSARNQCALLDQLLTGWGYAKARPSVADSKRSCAAQKPGGGPDATVVGLTLQDGQRYTDNVVNPSRTRTGKINGSRPVLEEREPLGSSGQCMLKLAVEPNSRAIVDVTGGTDTDAACKSAEDLADKLDPLLPKS
ncbi:hypothetical protein F9C11_02960 [Amycolatopsis sp. VS8301801F10]|uniref:hypothetical protein n=1 Tax=Amycolatopsis sp. VS8301801F10 TaxID=2652442 RepID=UPI0038FD2960